MEPQSDYVFICGKEKMKRKKRRKKNILPAQGEIFTLLRYICFANSNHILP